MNWQLVVVQLNVDEGKKNAVKQQYENYTENNSWFEITYALKAVKGTTIVGGCLKHCKISACGNLDLGFPPTAFLYSAKQGYVPAETLAFSSLYKCTKNCWSQF